jgi:hypothetical protein
VAFAVTEFHVPLNEDRKGVPMMIGVGGIFVDPSGVQHEGWLGSRTGQVAGRQRCLGPNEDQERCRETSSKTGVVELSAMG